MAAIALLLGPRAIGADGAGGRNGAFFDGVGDAGREVMARARERIEQNRKGQFSVQFVDESGKAIQGPVEIHLLRHEFEFGANLIGVMRLKDDDPAKAPALQAIENLFDMVTVGNFWSRMEPKLGGELSWDTVDTEVKWAQARDMHMRFHCIIYECSYASPKWGPQIRSADEWWPLIENRIRAVAQRYGKSVGEYDVINEMILNEQWAKQNNPTHPPLADPAVGARIIGLARKYLPDATLVSLETGLQTPSPKNAHAQAVYAYQKRLIELGAPVDVVGYQAHFFNTRGRRYQDGSTFAGPEAFTMRGIEAGLDHLATLGKPIRITEFSAPSRNAKAEEAIHRLSDEEIAAWEVNFYTLAFSKPYIQEVTRWFVVDGVGGRAMDGGLLTRDGRKKPSYAAIEKLLKHDWSTQWQGDLLKDGRAKFRGFYGTYEARIPGRAPVRFLAGEKQPRDLVVRIPKPQP